MKSSNHEVHRTALKRLIYTSRATREFSLPEHEAMRRDFARRNRDRDVTGALVTVGSRFLQVLEGSPATLDSLLEVIRADDRHEGLVVVYEETTGARRFAAWRMALITLERTVDSPDQNAGLRRLLEAQFTGERCGDDGRADADSLVAELAGYLLRAAARD